MSGAAPALRQGLRLRVGLAPSMVTSLHVLRLSLPDLHAALAAEAGENPYLVYRPPTARRGAMPGSVASVPSLVESVRAQIGLMPLAVEVRAAAEHLAGELRDDGYLSAGLDGIAAETGAPLALLEAGLAALQGCDPPGIGARTLTECLTLQLVDAGLARPLAAAVVARLEGFVEGAWAALSAEFGLAEAELRDIAALLPRLAAHPAVPVAPGAAAPLMPDLVVEPAADGSFRASLAREASPRLALDPALGRQGLSGQRHDALRARAEALVAGVKARGATLLRIGALLATHQAAFFARGPGHMRPLSRAEAAAELGLHPSTVGRAVAGKGVLANGRVHPLGMFFAAALPQHEGPALAGLAIRSRIGRIIAAEPPDRPLSDAAICRMLGAEGVDIARRTVAKYREWLRLPSSRQRRRAARLRASAPPGRGRLP